MSIIVSSILPYFLFSFVSAFQVCRTQDVCLSALNFEPTGNVYKKKHSLKYLLPKSRISIPSLSAKAAIDISAIAKNATAPYFQNKLSRAAAKHAALASSREREAYRMEDDGDTSIAKHSQNIDSYTRNTSSRSFNRRLNTETVSPKGSEDEDITSLTRLTRAIDKKLYTDGPRLVKCEALKNKSDILFFP